MKKMFLALAGIVALSSQAMASDVARSLVKLKVTEVSRNGVVLKDENFGRQHVVLVGIPTKVSTGSACIDVVGQESSLRPGGPAMSIVTLDVKGSADVINTACIEIFPMPVDLMLSVPLTLNPELPVAMASQLVKIDGRPYNVQLDLLTMKVKIQPVGIR